MTKVFIFLFTDQIRIENWFLCFFLFFLFIFFLQNVLFLCKEVICFREAYFLSFKIMYCFLPDLKYVLEKKQGKGIVGKRVKLIQ